MEIIKIKEIETERLILRNFKLNDVNDLYNNWGTDPNCNKFLPWSLHESLEESKSIIQKWIHESREGKPSWAIELKSIKEVIGSITLVDISKSNNTCEVGYCIGSKFWNKGYMTEALKTIIKYLFDEYNVHLVEAAHAIENVASGRVMEKTGMTKEAILKDRCYLRDNKYHDLVIYSIINKK